MPDPLLILGASTRAAAGSAIRAGLNPCAADLFCDDDLRQMVGGAKRSDDYPLDLPSLARSCPPSAWMFTGGLENHPKIVEAISAERVLWGVSSDSIQRVRDPWQLSRRLRQWDLRFPEVLLAAQYGMSAGHPPGRWIRKPYRSAGGGDMQLVPVGGGVSPIAEATGVPRRRDSKYYLQRVVEGQSQSAVFVAARGAAILLGVTRQLVGAGWTGATGFRYAGSIGPLQPSAAQRSQWRRIGDCLASGFDLQGLFGVDAIVDDRRIWTIEVNPRYSSSIEVLEFGLDLHALNEHVVACRDGRLTDRRPARGPRFRGKAVIYAARDVWIGDAFVQAARQANAGQAWPVIADIPTVAQTIEAGRPVATVFASGDRLTDIEPRLRDIVNVWRVKWQL